MQKIIQILIIVFFLAIMGLIIWQCRNNSENYKDTPIPIDCKGTYSNWSSCDPNTATMSRTFNITTQSANGGIPCPPATETISCPLDCVANWGSWSDCTVDGMMSRTLNVTTPAKNGGFCPTGISSMQVMFCPINCQGNWSDWSKCDPVSGTQQSSFNPTKQPANGGIPCPSGPNATRFRECPVDCQGNWLPWSDCDQKSGTQNRNFNITVLPKNGGQACPSTPQTQKCQVNCQGSYGVVGPCDPDTGNNRKDFNISYPPLNGGTGCPPLTLIGDCDIDCQGNWSEWSQCDPVSLTQKQTYTITQTNKNKGQKCPTNLEKIQSCQISSGYTGAYSSYGVCDPNTQEQVSYFIPTYWDGKTQLPPSLIKKCNICDNVKCDSGKTCIDGDCIDTKNLPWPLLYKDTTKNATLGMSAQMGNQPIGAEPCGISGSGGILKSGCYSCSLSDATFSNDTVIPVSGKVTCTGCMTSSEGKTCDIMLPDQTFSFDGTPGIFYFDGPSQSMKKLTTSIPSPYCYYDKDCIQLNADKTIDPNMTCNICKDGMGRCNPNC